MKNVGKKVCAAMMAILLVVSLLPVTDVQAATAPKLSAAAKTMYPGETFTLKVKKQPKNATLIWSSSNKNVVKVSKKGIAKALKKGSAKIVCKVKDKATAKTYTLKCKVTVKNGNQTVATQNALEKALKNKKLTKITIKSKKAAETFTIPKGSYKKVDLVVNAPNADVVNSGVFKSINVKAIKADTFTEKAKGNKITLSASKARLVVDEGATAANISIATKGADIAVVVNGTAKKVTVGADANVNVEANGTIKKMVLSAPATLAIKGTASNIPVNVKTAAQGAKLTSSVKLSVTVAAEIILELLKGAEGSNVVKSDASIKLEITNNTSQGVEVTTASGEVVETIPGQNDGGSTSGGGDGGSTSGGGDGGSASGGGDSSGGGSTSGGGSSSGGGGGSSTTVNWANLETDIYNAITRTAAGTAITLPTTVNNKTITAWAKVDTLPSGTATVKVATVSVTSGTAITVSNGTEFVVTVSGNTLSIRFGKEISEKKVVYLSAQVGRSTKYYELTFENGITTPGSGSEGDSSGGEEPSVVTDWASMKTALENKFKQENCFTAVSTGGGITTLPAQLGGKAIAWEKVTAASDATEITVNVTTGSAINVSTGDGVVASVTNGKLSVKFNAGAVGSDGVAVYLKATVGEEFKYYKLVFKKKA